MEFSILGPVQVSRNGAALRLAGNKQRALLALFVLLRGQVLSADRILAEAWPDAPPASGTSTVRYHISKLREILHGEDDEHALVTMQTGYVLDVDPDQIDASRFERMVDEARTWLHGHPDRASRLLRDALALWRGPALADVTHYPFASIEAARLETLRLHALEDRIEADLSCGRHAEIVSELEKLALSHPLRERLAGQLMVAQYRLGRQADALRTCQRLRRTLAEELGVNPGRDIGQLEERILVHDPSLVLGPRSNEAEARRAPVLTSVVVLPFQNLNRAEEDRFFADGLTEDLIHALARVEGLRVISRTSAFALREHTEDIREIGRQLRAEVVVDGSVRRTGNRIRITAELVDVADGYQLWSGRYDRERRDMFAIQEEVAQAIASALKGKLDRRPVVAVPRYTANMDAYEAFLEGRYYWHQQTADGFRRAMALLGRAVELDSEFGKAYAWRSILGTYLTIFGHAPPGEAFPAAREDARRAIAFEPTLTEAHLTLGLIAQYGDWDWDATERHYRQSIELSPGNAMARSWYGVFLARLGRGEEAIAQSAAALDLDPLSHESSWLYLVVLTHLGRHAEAVALGHRAATAYPHSAHLLGSTAMAHLGLGETDEALEWFRRSAACDPANNLTRAWVVRALAERGDVTGARRELSTLLQRSEQGYVSPFFLAIAHIGFRDHDQTIAFLQEAIQIGDPAIPYINHWALAPLAGDPRYQAMLDSLNLPNLFAAESAETVPVV